MKKHSLYDRKLDEFDFVSEEWIEPAEPEPEPKINYTIDGPDFSGVTYFPFDDNAKAEETAKSAEEGKEQAAADKEKEELWFRID